MNEIEVKILEIPFDEVLNILVEKGASKVFEGKIYPQIFDFPDKRIQKSGNLLRLRKKGDKVELVFKEKLKSSSDFKAYKEYEVYPDDFEKTRDILQAIGLISLNKIFAKKRVSYKLNDIMFEFDTYDGVPTFLEIEATSEEKIKEAVELIGYTMEDTKPWGGRELLKHYNKF